MKFISEFKSVNFFTLDLWNSLVNFPHKRFHLRTYPPHMLSSTSTRRSYHRNVQRGPALPNRRPQLAFWPSSDEDENVSDGGWVSVQATSSAANPATASSPYCRVRSRNSTFSATADNRRQTARILHQYSARHRLLAGAHTRQMSKNSRRFTAKQR